MYKTIYMYFTLQKQANHLLYYNEISAIYMLLSKMILSEYMAALNGCQYEKMLFFK